MKEATLQLDALALAGWLAEALPAVDPLSQRVHARALDLLEEVTAALQGLDRVASVHRADRALCSLRVLLRLAHETGRLDERRMLHLQGRVAEIGRQLGGWLRRLDSDTASMHRR